MRVRAQRFPSWFGSVPRSAMVRAVLLSLSIVVLGICLAILPRRYDLALALAFVIGPLVLVQPRWGLYLLVFLVPFQSIGSIQRGGFALTSTRMLSIVIVSSWLLQSICYRRRVRLSLPLIVPMIAFLIVLGLSLVPALSKGAALKEYVRWIEMFLVYAVVATTVRTRRDIALVVISIFVAGSAEALIGLRQSIGQIGPKSFALDTGGYRAYGTLERPNPFAGYLEMVLPIALALLVAHVARLFSTRKDVEGAPARERAPWLERVAYGNKPLLVVLRGLVLAVVVLVTALALVESLSRGGYMGFAVCCLAMMAISGRKSVAALIFVAVLGAVLALFGAFSILPSALTERFAAFTMQFRVNDLISATPTPDNFPVLQRMAFWLAAWDMFRHNVILGVGIGNFDAAYPSYLVRGWWDSLGHAHNYYLNIAAEAGSLGLITYLVLIYRMFANAWRASRLANDLYLRALCIGVFGVVTAIAVHNVVDDLHVFSFGIQLATLLGLATAVRRLSEERAIGTRESSRGSS